MTPRRAWAMLFASTVALFLATRVAASDAATYPWTLRTTGGAA